MSKSSEKVKKLTLKEKRQRDLERKQKKRNDKESRSPKVNRLIDHYQNRQYGDAEQLAREIVEKSPSNLWAWKILVSVFQRMGRKLEAVNALRTIIALSPKDADSHYNLANLLLESGSLDEAEVTYKAVIALKPKHAEAHGNLGLVFARIGKIALAESTFRQAITLKTNFADAHYNLGKLLMESERLEEAEASFRQAIRFKFDFTEAHHNLGSILNRMGKTDLAQASFKQVLALKPNDPTAKHFVAALAGETPTTAPLEFVESLFDSYAAKFDNALVENLGYKTPKVIAEMVVRFSEPGTLGSIMDLGCGTGLFGEQIKHRCENIEGIDVSEKMLSIAKQKDVYDRLIKKDISAYLSNATLNFDCFVATDVFVYLGDLADIFRLIKTRNKKSGKLAFSTEHLEGDGYNLKQTGRYSHSKKYVEFLCEQFGFTLCHFETENLRKDRNEQIIGGLYLLEF